MTVPRCSNAAGDRIRLTDCEQQGPARNGGSFRNVFDRLAVSIGVGDKKQYHIRMKENKTYILFLAIAVGVVAFAGKGLAAVGGTSVGVQYSVQGNISGSGASETGTESGGHANTSSEGGGHAAVSASGSLDLGGEANAENASGSESENGSSSGIGSVISASAMEVQGWDSAQKEQFLNTVKTEAEVRSGQDLQNFAKGVILRDQGVESVDIATDTVKVSYREPAKLFGIFNSGLTAQIEADSSGHATVSYPWYSFLFSMPSSAASAHLETAINAGLSGVSLKDNVQVLAHALATITGILQGSSTVSASGQ